jgi:hypothetical protein
MVEKNICQNPTCWEKRNKDQWNKKANAYQSRKAYSSKNGGNARWGYPDGILAILLHYLLCPSIGLCDNLENIVERNHIVRIRSQKK